MSRVFIAASTEYLEVDAAPVTTYPFSMFCKAWVDDVATEYGLFMLVDASTPFERMGLVAAGADGGDPLRAFREGGRSAFSSTAMSAGGWHNCLAVFASDSSCRVYLDGGGSVENTDVDVQDITQFSRISIGALRDSTPANYLSGRTSHAAIWNVALDANDALLLNEASPLFVKPDGLIFYAPMDGDEDFDIIGGLELTAGGTPTTETSPAILTPTSPKTGLAAPAGLDGSEIYTGTDAFDIPSNSILLFDNTPEHTGSDNASVLTDSAQAWTVSEWVDLIVRNDTDLSLATITANTATTITGTLAGGTDNDWDTDDLATIVAVIDNPDVIHYATTTNLGGTVTVNGLGVPVVDGDPGIHTFDFQLEDVSDGNSLSDIYTATVNTIPVPSVVITGTTVPSATEAEMVTGGQTTILTAANDTWVTAGATFDAQRQAIINGITAASTPTNGWNNEVRDNAAVTSVVRTSSTVVTITWAAQAGYDITSNETITATIPASALTTSTTAVVASPTFTITAVSAGTVGTGILRNPLRNIIRNPLRNILRRAFTIVQAFENVTNSSVQVTDNGENVTNTV